MLRVQNDFEWYDGAYYACDRCGAECSEEYLKTIIRAQKRPFALGATEYPGRWDDVA